MIGKLNNKAAVHALSTAAVADATKSYDEALEQLAVAEREIRAWSEQIADEKKRITQTEQNQLVPSWERTT